MQKLHQLKWFGNFEWYVKFNLIWGVCVEWGWGMEFKLDLGLPKCYKGIYDTHINVTK